MLCERNPHRSHKDFVTLVEGKVLIGVESLTSIFSNQSDDIMVEDVERETLSVVSLEVRLEEVVSPLEEIPGMVKLDALQLGKVVVLIFGAKNIVENGCRNYGGCANGTSSELFVISCNEIEDGRDESGH